MKLRNKEVKKDFLEEFNIMEKYLPHIIIGNKFNRWTLSKIDDNQVRLSHINMNNMKHTDIDLDHCTIIKNLSDLNSINRIKRRKSWDKTYYKTLALIISDHTNTFKYAELYIDDLKVIHYKEHSDILSSFIEDYIKDIVLFDLGFDVLNENLTLEKNGDVHALLGENRYDGHISRRDVMVNCVNSDLEEFFDTLSITVADSIGVKDLFIKIKNRFIKDYIKTRNLFIEDVTCYYKKRNYNKKNINN